MKKALFAVLAMVCMSFASCGNSTSTEAVDSLAVDTLVDTTVVVEDTVTADTVVADCDTLFYGEY